MAFSENTQNVGLWLIEALRCEKQQTHHQGAGIEGLTAN